MQSQTKLSPVVGRDGIQGGRSGRKQEAETATIELDSTLAANVGLTDGMKVHKARITAMLVLIRFSRSA